MSKWDKIKNLKRLHSEFRPIIISYLLKTIVGVKPSAKENATYIFYNFLIQFNGQMIEESENSLTAIFKNGKKKIIKLRKPPSSDFDVFKQVFYWKEYLPVVKCFHEHFKPEVGATLNILDCGSNIGLTSLFLLDHFPGSRIIAIEPETNNFNILNYNLNQSLYPGTEIIKGAIWSKNTRIQLVKDFRDKSDWSYRVKESDKPDAIKAFSLNQIIKERQMNYIDILKIDIEGSEKEIFTSKRANLDFLDITKCLAIEIHDEFNCRKEINHILVNKGYKIFHSGEFTIAFNLNLKNI